MHKSSAQTLKTTESLGSVTVLEGSKSSMAEKVLLILELIANSEFPLTLENISSGIGLAKPTAFRLLNTLVSQGFIERDANGRRFQPSAKFRLMGIGLLRRFCTLTTLSRHEAIGGDHWRNLQLQYFGWQRGALFRSY
jgi:predicted transcriptional regulator